MIKLRSEVLGSILALLLIVGLISCGILISPSLSNSGARSSGYGPQKRQEDRQQHGGRLWYYVVITQTLEEWDDYEECLEKVGSSPRWCEITALRETGREIPRASYYKMSRTTERNGTQRHPLRMDYYYRGQQERLQRLGQRFSPRRSPRRS